MSQQEQDAQGFMLNTVEDATIVPHSDLALGAFAEKIYQSRRERDKKFQVQALFQDPAWDILLDLFISHVGNKNISVMSAGLAGQVPPSTALRWVWALEEAKLVERRADKNDKRRSFVLLTAEGLSHMRDLLTSMSDRLQPRFCEASSLDNPTV